MFSSGHCQTWACLSIWDLIHCNTSDNPEIAKGHHMKTVAQRITDIFGLQGKWPIFQILTFPTQNHRTIKGFNWRSFRSGLLCSCWIHLYISENTWFNPRRIYHFASNCGYNYSMRWEREIKEKAILLACKFNVKLINNNLFWDCKILLINCNKWFLGFMLRPV